MYIIVNGQMIRPETPTAVSPKPRRKRTKKKSRWNRLSKRCRQMILVLFILIVIYIFTCTDCKSVISRRIRQMTS